jgi:hypothetical protein
MPPGVVYVGRPTKWGNPWKPADFLPECPDRTPEELATLAVAFYRQAIVNGDCGVPTIDVIQRELRGKTLACWCRVCEKHKKAGLPIGEKCKDCSPCHADVLIEIANRIDAFGGTDG